MYRMSIQCDCGKNAGVLMHGNVHQDIAGLPQITTRHQLKRRSVVSWSRVLLLLSVAIVVGGLEVACAEEDLAKRDSPNAISTKKSETVREAALLRARILFSAGKFWLAGKSAVESGSVEGYALGVRSYTARALFSALAGDEREESLRQAFELARAGVQINPDDAELLVSAAEAAGWYSEYVGVSECYRMMHCYGVGIGGARRWWCIQISLLQWLDWVYGMWRSPVILGESGKVWVQI